MVLYVLRAIFILLMAAVGWFYFQHLPQWGSYAWLAMVCATGLGIVFVCIDTLAPRRKLAIFSGTFLGVVVGMVLAYALSFVVRLLLDQYYQPGGNIRSEDLPAFYAGREVIRAYVTMLIGVVSCYLSISFILQTKDDFRFIIPYVEFSKQTKGARAILLDTSALVDGRVADIAATGILESQLIVPRFVLDELQSLADSADRLKRGRGRRGLDILSRLQHGSRADVVLYDLPRDPAPDLDVDKRLLELARDLNGRVLTNDYNLNKVAQLTGVDVINVNDLAGALKPVVLPGEKMRVLIVKPGEESGQGVGYLEDGTMVVVEQARGEQNNEVEFTVTRALQTSAGRMIFGRLGEDAPSLRRSRDQAVGRNAD